MRQIPRSERTGFRRAVMASVAIHLALAAIVVVSAILPRSSEEATKPGIDTRIPDIKLRLDPEESHTIAPPEPRRLEQAPPAPPAPTPSPHISTETARTPTIISIPNALPPELLAIIQRSRSTSVTPTPPSPIVDSNVKPATAVSSPGPGASPLHGAMKPGQSVVYILDCSGSMGEFGKFARARAALIATLSRQPEGVRFQVILYNSTVRQLIPGGLITVAANIQAAETRLATVEPAGRSNHAEALRMAAGLHADAIVWLTDADDLSFAKLKPALTNAGKPMPVYVAEVTARGVGNPQELR